MSTATPLMTAEEMLALPDNGSQQQLSGDPDLPGFRMTIAELFDL